MGEQHRSEGRLASIVKGKIGKLRGHQAYQSISHLLPAVAHSKSSSLHQVADTVAESVAREVNPMIHCYTPSSGITHCCSVTHTHSPSCHSIFRWRLPKTCRSRASLHSLRSHSTVELRIKQYFIQLLVNHCCDVPPEKNTLFLSMNIFIQLQS